MRLKRTVLLVCALVMAVGCTSTTKTNSPSWTTRIRSLWAGLGPDSVQLELALIQQPIGDAYLAQGLWREIDEQVVPIELRPALEANGFRIGTISGTVPSGLQRLLTTEKLTCVMGHTWEVSGSANTPGDRSQACPHCKMRSVSRESLVTARHRGAKPGEPFFQPLGPTDKPLKVNIHQEGESSHLEYEGAQAGLQIQITPGEHGEVLLKCEPRVQHGSFLRLPQPSEDKSGWSFTPGRPEKEFPKLAWEVALETNEYLILGAWSDRPETLGQHCFLQKEPGTQSILVLRVWRPQGEAADTAVAGTVKPASSSGPLPLALQSILPKRPPPPAVASRGQSE